MTLMTEVSTQPQQQTYRIVGLSYVSLYYKDLTAAVAFYSQVFGPPASVDTPKAIYGWRMGSTWLTLLPSKAGTDPARNPSNSEFAVQVASTGEVDQLYQALIGAGAQECMAPADTQMYDPMRFACVDDPFGVRIDVYCPL